MKTVGEKARPERRRLRMGIQTLRITCEAASIRRCQRKEHCACPMSASISCSFSSSSRTFSLRVTPCNSGLSLVGPALPFRLRLQGEPDLISSAAVVIATMVMSSLESDVLDATLEAILSAPLTHAVSCNLRSGYSDSAVRPVQTFLSARR